MKPSPFYYECVSDPAERQRYIDNYFAVSGNELPMAYLEQAVVYQFYRGPRPVAGFILNANEWYPLRYLSYLSAGCRAALMQDEDLTENDFLEISANWKVRNELSTQEDQTYYFVMLTQAYKQARQHHKTLLMGGSVIKKVKAIQQQLMPRTIYHGPVSAEHLDTVRNKTALLKIYVAELWSMPLKAVLILLWRYITLTRRNKAVRDTWEQSPSSVVTRPDESQEAKLAGRPPAPPKQSVSTDSPA